MREHGALSAMVVVSGRRGLQSATPECFVAARGAGAMITVRVRLFAMLRERVGKSELTLELPDRSQAGAVFDALGMGGAPAGVRLAVNRTYAEPGVVLADGDEVALIPPVSGGEEQRIVAELTTEPIDLAGLVRRVTTGSAGAVVSFQGTVRDHTDGDAVTRLEYEVFDAMALSELRRIAEALQTAHDLVGVGIVHRTGSCRVGDVTVAIACASAHRAAAFAACSEAIETLKTSVPIWKKEVRGSGAVWVGVGS